jgi:hypothetical protein
MILIVMVIFQEKMLDSFYHIFQSAILLPRHQSKKVDLQEKVVEIKFSSIVFRLRKRFLFLLPMFLVKNQELTSKIMCISIKKCLQKCSSVFLHYSRPIFHVVSTFIDTRITMRNTSEMKTDQVAKKSKES